MKQTANKRAVLVLAMIALLLTVTVGGTVAYLATKTTAVENVFQPADVTSSVVETFSSGDQEKKDVKIRNTGNVTAYIRAAIVVTWQDESGNVYPTVPLEGAKADYTLSLNTGSGATDWTKNGDYYYYNSSVAAGSTTENLIDSCKVKSAAPAAGYTLHVEIVGSAIQAEPTDAVKAAWGFVPGAN